MAIMCPGKELFGPFLLLRVLQLHFSTPMREIDFLASLYIYLTGPFISLCSCFCLQASASDMIPLTAYPLDISYLI